MSPANPSDSTPRSVARSTPYRIIAGLSAAILAWGVYHAIGAWQLNHNPMRAVVVLACVLVFLGFWMTMLAVRQRRLSKGG